MAVKRQLDSLPKYRPIALVIGHVDDRELLLTWPTVRQGRDGLEMVVLPASEMGYWAEEVAPLRLIAGPFVDRGQVYVIYRDAPNNVLDAASGGRSA
jgi:hypothetical protein